MEIKTRTLPLACLLQAGRDARATLGVLRSLPTACLLLASWDDRATLGVLRSLPTACLLQAGRDDKATLGFVIPNVGRELSDQHIKH